MNWRTPITMVVLLGVLLGAAFYGWQTIISPGGDAKVSAPTPTGPTCQKKTLIKKGQRIAARDVIVNVYNAGQRAGLAGETLDELVNKGFKRGVAANAPSSLAVGPNVTVILPGGQGAPQTRLVHNQFIGKVLYLKSAALTQGVDVVVGESFRGVDHAARTFVRVNHPVTTCSPATTSAG